ncbi:MAG TPA: adenosylcobinamide-phosphate synthase CbiB [Actinophytocola sp.]|nr:adenosylcobinamide-phosphate synthase CbiB [Actinophytocola sp.]
MSVLVAAALDAAVAEPPAAVHPVVWIGRYLDGVAGAVPAEPRRSALVLGGAAWAAGAVVSVAAAVAVDRVAGRVGGPARIWVRGASLWPLLSARMLLREVRAVEGALVRDTDAGRRALSRIVSRDTTELSPADVRGAAIESLAENLADAVVAPLTWYLLAGLPGAALYRFANTADACWGYRDRRWQYAGRVAARADDALNVVPARLTAVLLRGRADWSRLRTEARRTDSPNAGWPMAAVALRLDLRLTKPGHYTLNPSGSDPVGGDVERAVRVVRNAVLLAVAVAAVAEHLLKPDKGERQ